MGARVHVYPEYTGAGGADHGFPSHRPGCSGDTASACACWEDLVIAKHLTDGRICWCYPQVLNVLGTDNKVVVHRRCEC